MKKALITGITGQDGSFLAELLLKKGYQVVGLVSDKFSIGDENIKTIKDRIVLEQGDLLEEESLLRIINKHKPKEIYNLGGITFIPTSWEKPELTFQINSLGLLKLLKIMREVTPKTRLFQATSATIFGKPVKVPQDEATKVNPQTPYAVSKAAAHFLVQNFRHHFHLFACSGIMYNHESERRGVEFVTRKITLNAAKIKLGLAKKLILGNLKARVDWGYAPDYVKAMWLMLQQERADDFILATGKVHSVEDVCKIAFSHLDLNWKKYIRTDKSFYRKEEAVEFCGNISKAQKKLGWQPETDFSDMIRKMVDYDIKFLQRGVKNE